MNGYGKVQYSGVTDADIRGRQMDELIRKQDALDAAIKADMENHNGILSEKRARVFEEHISILPPVQMDDAISRQAAIYIASGYCHPANVANELAKLPSVQPTLMRSIGKLIGYTGNPCPNCGRLRVERYESGLEICEKCNWCEQTKSYWLDWEER